MRLSVIIPVGEASPALDVLLQSLALQKFPREQFEILLVFNVLIPPLSLPADLSCKILCTEVRGVNRARNLGADEALGQVLLFLDDDVRLLDENFLARVVAAHENFSEVAIGGPYLLPKGSLALGQAYHSLAEAWLRSSPQLLGGNVSYKRKVFDQGLRFDPEIAFGGAESEFHERLLRRGERLRLCEELAVEHSSDLNWRQFLSKGFRQGFTARRAHLRNRELPWLSSDWPQKILRFFYRRAFALGEAWASYSLNHSQPRAWRFILRTTLRASLAFPSYLWWSLSGRRWQRELLPQDFSERFYLLKHSGAHAFHCPHCELLGCKQTGLLPIFDQLQRAQSSGYSAVEWTYQGENIEESAQLIGKIRELGMRPVIRLVVDGSQLPSTDILQELQAQGCSLNLILSRHSWNHPLFTQILKLNCDWYLTWLYLGPEDFAQQLLSLKPQWLERLYFYVPYAPMNQEGDYSALSFHLALKKWQAQLLRQGLSPMVRGPRGSEIHNPQLNHQRDLDPQLRQLFSGQSASPQIEISVIIPSFQAGYQIGRVLTHLLRQDLNPNRYEIIVVDDGSQDGSADSARILLDTFQQTHNFKYFYFSRELPSGQHDSQFRAGICRNWGAQVARGKILSFLDSDMLTPRHYLSRLLEQQPFYEVIQCRREMLKEQASHPQTEYEQVQPVDLYREEFYWEKFKNTRDWQSLHNHWKYACTYSLTLSRELFDKAGRFRRSFHAYGFEDTDLAYRLSLMGAHFHLEPLSLFHLHPQKRRFEHHRDRTERTKVLSESARIFYHHHLSARIFIDFHWFLDSPRTRLSSRLEQLFYHYLMPAYYFVCNQSLWKSLKAYEKLCEAYASNMRKAHHYNDRLRTQLWPQIQAKSLILLKPYYFLAYQWRRFRTARSA